MTGLLIADTVAWGDTGSAPMLLLQALTAYRQQVLQRSLQTLYLPTDLTQVNWGSTWQEYVQLLEGKRIPSDRSKGDGDSQDGRQRSSGAIAIAYPGSFGDAIDAHSTLASLCQDWRLSALLTLPPHPQALSIAIAFTALAHYHKTPLLGYVFVGKGNADVAQLTDSIEKITRVPLIGHIPLSLEKGSAAGLDRSQELQQTASHLNWELLPW